jgi:hypothetical protein
MSDEQKQEEQKTEQETEEQESQLSNSDVKNHPLFQKVAAELAEKNKADREREEAEAKAKAEKAEEEAKAKGDYEEALRLRDEQVKAAETRATTKEIEAELVKAGCIVTPGFLKVSVAEFGLSDEKDVAQFVSSMKSDEGYSEFFASKDKTALRQKAPVVKGVQNTSKLSTKQALEMEKSDDPAQRKQANQYLDAYYRQHGKFPD